MSIQDLFNGSYSLQEEIEKAYKTGARDAFYSDLAREYHLGEGIESIEIETLINNQCNEYINIEA